MPDQPFDQRVGHAQAGHGPVPPLPDIAPAEAASQPQPAQQQTHLQSSPSTGAEHERGQDQLDDRQEAEHATAQGERFDGLGLYHSPKELARPLVTHLLWRQAQGPRQEPWLQEPTNANREPSLHPGAPQTQRNQRQ